MKEFIKVDKTKHQVTGSVTMMLFKDHDQVIAYIPSLDMSGYGTTEKEAEGMITVTVEEYFRSLLPQPLSVITQELLKYGWKQERYFNKRFHPEAYVDKAGVLMEFNLPQDAFIKEEALQVAS